MKKASGYILIEVLIAISILSLLVVPVIGMTSQGLQRLNTTQKYTEALYFAQGEMEYLKSLDYNQLSEQTFQIRESSNFYSDVSITSIDGTKLLYIKLLVTWKENDLPKQITLETYIAKR